ncbi:MAG: PKD domain-containing protein [Vicinamibacterales bacterium]
MRSSVFCSLIVATLAVAGCGGGSGSSNPTPTTPTAPTVVANRVPSITNVTLSPAFGVSGVTVISMSATATDADNDALTYQWSFAGKTMSGSTVASAVTGDGAVTVDLTVTDGKGGTARDSRTVTIGSMNGRWTFIFTGACSPAVPTVLPILALTQTENLVTGDLTSPAAWCNVPAGQGGKLDPAAPAKIDADGNFTGARLKIGSYQDTFLTGKMDSTGRTITGTTRANLGSTSTFRMVKQ